MTEQELDAAMQRDIQLHESVEITYIIDGWYARYSPDDGNTFRTYWGATPLEALKKAFERVQNTKGRT